MKHLDDLKAKLTPKTPAERERPKDWLYIMSELLPCKHTPDFLFSNTFVSPFLIPFQNPCSVTQCWSWSIIILPPVACAGIVQWYVLPPDDNMVGLYSLSVEKSVPLFLQTYSVSDEFFNKGLS